MQYLRKNSNISQDKRKAASRAKLLKISEIDN